MSKDTDNVSKVIILWRNTCLFLQKNTNEWELPGGHVELGETFKKAAIREVFEETSLKITKLKPVLKQKDFHLYVCKPKVLKVVLSDEHINYKWLNIKQIPKIKITKSTKLNIHRILNVIQSV